MNWYIVYAYALVSAFVVALFLTAVVRRLAIRWQFYDYPGDRKMHDEPVPVMGGAAIFATFFLITGVNLLALWILPVERLIGGEWLDAHVIDFLGPNVGWKLTGIFLGGMIIFVLGLLDDIVALGPMKKLVGQVAAALVLVYFGMQVNLFIPDPLLRGAITVLWVLTIINAMNFLDNMDGLAPGVSVIAALSFFICVAPQGHTFIAVLLMVFAGSVAGFLYHNLYPARIFMGDTGSMFCGYVLATVPVVATFYTPDTPSRVAVAAPIVALSVPLFDILSVVYIRWRDGQSIMQGDKRHFSHRLVELGMTPRQAVEFIFLVAAICGLGAALLPQVALAGTLIILAQLAGIFLLIVLLMRARPGKGLTEP